MQSNQFSKIIQHTFNVQGEQSTEHVKCWLIGKFRMLHKGHQELINQGQASGQKWGMITFYPSPEHAILKEQNKPFHNFFNLRGFFHQAKTVGASKIHYLIFNHALRTLSYQDFFDYVLLQTLQVEHLIVGEDFRFGYNRQGDIEKLKQLCQQHNIKLQIIPLLADETSNQGQKISTTHIHELLHESKMETANSLLGYPFYIVGKVKHGDKRGRTIDFPTLNIAVPKYGYNLQYGVYVVKIKFIKTDKSELLETEFQGIANLGIRPSFEVKRPLLEVHILDFNTEVYGDIVQIEFLHYMRAERKMSGLEELKQQLEQDKENSRKYL